MADLHAFWNAHGPHLRNEFPLDSHHPECGSWLFARVVDEKICGIGCKACHLADVQTEFGLAALVTKRQLRVQRLHDHANALSHMAGRVSDGPTKCNHKGLCGSPFLFSPIRVCSGHQCSFVSQLFCGA